MKLIDISAPSALVRSTETLTAMLASTAAARVCSNNSDVAKSPSPASARDCSLAMPATTVRRAELHEFTAESTAPI